MATPLGDILINGTPYLLIHGTRFITGYHQEESFRTRPNPVAQPRTLSTFEHQNEWQWFGQSDWNGMNVPDYTIDSFLTGFGLDLQNFAGGQALGGVKIAPRLELSQADITNPAGYVAFTVGGALNETAPNTTKVVFGGRTNGKMFVRDTATGIWTSSFPLTGAATFRSWGSFNNAYVVGGSDGHIYTVTNGAALTVTDRGLPPGAPTLDAQFLGAFKGKAWFGYPDGSVATIDTTFTLANAFPAGSTDQAIRTGAVGTNVLYIITNGPNVRILFTDGVNLYQATVIGTDFLSENAVFLGKLFIFGWQSSTLNKKGACWALGANGLEEVFVTGDMTFDAGIRSAVVSGEMILFTFTGREQSGVGVFDPRLDISKEFPLGFYVNSTLAATYPQTVIGDGVMYGIAEAIGKRYVGQQKTGIYVQTTPHQFKIVGGLFGAEQRNINKLWGQAEVRHSAFTGGQFVTVSTTKNPTDAVEPWGTDVAGSTLSKIAAPASYRTPFLSYILTGEANGADLTIFDIALSYIRAAATADVKRHWTIGIDCSGSLTEPRFFRDGSPDARIWSDIFTTLNGLWNTVVTFEDIDGRVFTCLFKDPAIRPSAGDPNSREIDKKVVSGTITNLSLLYEVHLVEV